MNAVHFHAFVEAISIKQFYGYEKADNNYNILNDFYDKISKAEQHINSIYTIKEDIANMKEELFTTLHKLSKYNKLLLKENINLKKKIDELQNECEKSYNLCNICFVNKINIAYWPCGHASCCSKCGSSLKYCPICNSCVEGVNDIFIV